MTTRHLMQDRRIDRAAARTPALNAERSGIRHRLRAVVLGASLLALPHAASAMNGLLFIDPPPETGSRLAVGASVLAFPDYPGAKSFKGLLIPAVDYAHASGAFVSTDVGVGWEFAHRKDIQAGVRLWPQLARKTDAARLNGLDPIGARLEKGAFFNYSPADVLMLQSGLRYGAGREGDGALFELGATSGVPLPGGDLLGLTLGATWANKAWRQSYFGVSAAEAARSTMPAYALGGGWQDVQCLISHEHRFNPKWAVDTQLTLARLLGQAARSPVAERPGQATLSLSLWYRF